METPKQYMERILSLVAGQDAWAILESSPAVARELVDGLPPVQLTRRVGGRWSIAEIVAHLADAELVAAWRLRAALAQDGVPFQPFDQDAWAEAFKYSEIEVAASLDLFELVRRANLQLLRRVDPARHRHAGLHQERGRESVEHLVTLYAGHDLNHLKQIEQLAR